MCHGFGGARSRSAAPTMRRVSQAVRIPHFTLHTPVAAATRHGTKHGTGQSVDGVQRQAKADITESSFRLVRIAYRSFGRSVVVHSHTVSHHHHQQFQFTHSQQYSTKHQTQSQHSQSVGGCWLRLCHVLCCSAS